jgi:hypothetical protein
MSIQKLSQNVSLPPLIRITRPTNFFPFPDGNNGKVDCGRICVNDVQL